MVEVKVHKGEPIERALRRFKNKVDATGLMEELRNRRRFNTKAQKKKIKQRALDRLSKLKKHK